MLSSIDESFEQEYQDARSANAVGYMARLLVQATLPHRHTPGSEYHRKNGALTLSIQGDPDAGLPYGHYPRLLLCWMTTEAVRTKSPRLALGDSLTHFMAQLGLIPSGGRWGTITRLRQHCQRLFSATIRWKWSAGNTWANCAMVPVTKSQMFWDPAHPAQLTLGGDDLSSFVQLSAEFYEEVITRPVPIDTRVLHRLAQLRSPLAIDLYCWLTFRRSYLEEPLKLRWEFLAAQFGADYKRLRAFRERAIRWLRILKYEAHWDDLFLKVDKDTLTLHPGLPHVLPAHLR